MKEEIYQWIIAGLTVALVVSISANLNVQCEGMEDMMVARNVEEWVQEEIVPMTSFSSIEREWGTPICESTRGNEAIKKKGSDISKLYAETEEEMLYLKIQTYDAANPELGYEFSIQGKRQYQLRVFPDKEYFLVEQEIGTPRIFAVEGAEDIAVSADGDAVIAMIPLRIIDAGPRVFISSKIFNPFDGMFDDGQCGTGAEVDVDG